MALQFRNLGMLLDYKQINGQAIISCVASLFYKTVIGRGNQANEKMAVVRRALTSDRILSDLKSRESRTEPTIRILKNLPDSPS